MNKIILIGFIVLLSNPIAFGQKNYLLLGNEWLNQKEFEKAEQVFREAITAEPENTVYKCQLGFTQIQQKNYEAALKTFSQVLAIDSNNVAALWYSGIAHFYAENDKEAINKFEKAIKFLDKKSGQYSSANWFIGKCYSILLKTEGLTYDEVDRMFECYEEYLKLQPNAPDAEEIREYIERKKQRRPSRNVEKWIDL